MWWDLDSVRSQLTEWMKANVVGRHDIIEFLLFSDTLLRGKCMIRKKRTVAASVMLCLWHLYGNNNREHPYYPRSSVTGVPMTTVESCFQNDGFFRIMKAYRIRNTEREIREEQLRLEAVRLSSPMEIASGAPSPMMNNFEEVLRRWFVSNPDVFVIVYIAEHRLHNDLDFISGRVKYVDFLTSVGERLSESMIENVTAAIFARDPPLLLTNARLDIIVPSYTSLAEKWNSLLAYPFVKCLPCEFVIGAIRSVVEGPDDTAKSNHIRATDFIHVEVGAYSDEKDLRHPMHSLKKKGAITFYRNDVLSFCLCE